MKTILIVKGQPQPQPRPRATAFAGRARVYHKRGKVDAWRAEIVKAWRDSSAEKFKGPISVSIIYRFARPKKHYKGSILREDAPQYHSIKPDLDNLLKATLDALTDAGAWDDDAQVVHSSQNKVWAQDASAQIIIEIVKEGATE